MMDDGHAAAGAVLPPQALGQLMPMFLWVLPTGHICQAGPTLRKLCGEASILGRRILEAFEIVRPRAVQTMAELGSLVGARLHLRLRDGPQTHFRGQIVALTLGQGLLVNLSFGIGVEGAVRTHGLTDADFAPTDLAVELLYLQEAKGLVLAELSDTNQRLASARASAEALALSDALTGLANRRAFDQALTRACEAAARGGGTFALMHVDLDFFKAVNDRLGHAAGDHMLGHAARILAEETRKQDLAARVGGDEFTLIVRGITDEIQLADLARRIIARLEEPVTFQEGEARISGSVGITTSSLYGKPDAEKMLAHADLALYASKQRGRAQATFYTQGMEMPEDRRAAV